MLSRVGQWMGDPNVFLLSTPDCTALLNGQLFSSRHNTEANSDEKGQGQTWPGSLFPLARWLKGCWSSLPGKIVVFFRNVASTFQWPAFWVLLLNSLISLPQHFSTYPMWTRKVSYVYLHHHIILDWGVDFWQNSNLSFIERLAWTDMANFFSSVSPHKLK